MEWIPNDEYEEKMQNEKCKEKQAIEAQIAKLQEKLKTM